MVFIGLKKNGLKRAIVLFPGDEDRNLTLPSTDQTRRLVAQVSKPAVSPAFRLRGAPKRRSGATAAKPARRWESPGLRVLKPATSPERLRGTPTCPSPLRFDATAPKPEAKAGKSVPQGQAAPPLEIAPRWAATTRNRASQRRWNIRGRVRILAQRT
jgi:hypothetical protein